jgi:DNA-binding response OmpR family regulator
MTKREASMKVLLADDDADTTTRIESYLKQQGHKVIVARDAMRAIMTALRQPPDAILLDVTIPRLGLQVLRQLKNSVNTATVPIIVLCASCNADLISTVKELGADRFVRKPPNLRELSEVLSEFAQDALASRARAPFVAPAH